MVTLTADETRTILRLMTFIRGEGFPLREDEDDVGAKLYISLFPPLPKPPANPHSEDDEYEPNLNLSQDV